MFSCNIRMLKVVDVVNQINVKFATPLKRIMTDGMCSVFITGNPLDLFFFCLSSILSSTKRNYIDLHYKTYAKFKSSVFKTARDFRYTELEPYVRCVDQATSVVFKT